MSRLAILTAVTAALALATAAVAGTSSATTSFNGETPTAGTTLEVTFTLYTTAPVVPYEYALQNTCVYPTKLSGHYTLGQHDAIAAWTDTDPVTHAPMVTMPVYLESVPPGSTCRVSLLDGNTIVKGSTVSYTVS